MAPGARRRRGWRRRANAVLLVAAMHAPGARASGNCTPRFIPPKEAPLDATRYNGLGLRACFTASGPHHVFVIADWGGEGDPPRPVDRRSPQFPGAGRTFVAGVDDRAQLRVAEQMRRRAKISNPDYILNAGDNFYWGGIKTKCGARPYTAVNTHQWGPVFEHVYHGPGLDGKQWLGILGNHDYGGYTFAMGWDQVIGYTWGGPPPCTGRWMTPAQYWSANVKYPGFTVDYYFMDTNVYNAFDPKGDPDHNICSSAHTPTGAACGEEGPSSAEDCPLWFRRLWRDQTLWVHRLLSNSTADWQVIVTHFPPTFGRVGWERLVAQHGVDLIISGHVHQIELHHMEAGNFLRPTAWLVAGGGGGITSEGVPSLTGADDQYGFFDLTLSKEEISVAAISHGGQVRRTTKVVPRKPAAPLAVAHPGPRKEAVVVDDRPSTEHEGTRATGSGNHAQLQAPSANARSTAPPPSGGERVIDHHTEAVVTGEDTRIIGLGYGAVVAFIAAVGLGSFCYLNRARLRADLLDVDVPQNLFLPVSHPIRTTDVPGPIHNSSKAGSYVSTAGYSTLPNDSQKTRMDDMDEGMFVEPEGEEAIDEFNPAAQGCFCWPSSRRKARYHLLQPA
eukprot:CAMPEP_0175764726 /NCGR_PEP_ID=MMETSP0097-20121207/68431_1 /TAXON_ID=311494 /ORGANISM="Alexandrium monilatum, Strain CCMP3105" /LENGTH=616 /DNA_ID=CAMNT_0017074555 /DNA_START=1 /DNA_END=1851 /DNA_ORIENTATION=+